MSLLCSYLCVVFGLQKESFKQNRSLCYLFFLSHLIQHCETKLLYICWGRRCSFAKNKSTSETSVEEDCVLKDQIMSPTGFKTPPRQHALSTASSRSTVETSISISLYDLAGNTVHCTALLLRHKSVCVCRKAAKASACDQVPPRLPMKHLSDPLWSHKRIGYGVHCP